jgi:transcriptional regulator with XRE-family HTH domain
MSKEHGQGRKLLSDAEKDEARRLRQKVGIRIKMRRMAINLPLTSLAEEVSLLYQTIQKYEAGTGEPSLLTFRRLAKSLKVPMTFFFEEDDDDLHSITQEEYALLSKYKDASPAVRQAVLHLLKVVVDEAGTRDDRA